MNLLYDHSIFQQRYGGISRYFYEIISRFLFFDNVNIEMFMGLFVNQYGLEKFKPKFSRYLGWSVPPLRYTGRVRQFLNRQLWRAFQLGLPAQNRIYHPTYYDYYKARSIKTVFTVYDFTHERYPELFRGDPTPALKASAFERADSLLCISEATKRDLLELYPHTDSSKVKVVHLGYSQLQICSGAISMVLPTCPYFLFVGPRHAYKNFSCLVEAFAHSLMLRKNSVIVCFGGAPFSSDEKSAFYSKGIGEKVIHYPGHDRILGWLYKNALALVYPSLYEGFGIPILEAMSCECPVIASNTSSIPEVAGNAAMLFDPTAPELLENHMCRVMTDVELRATMKVAGLSRCQLFSWDRCAQETLGFYKKVQEA